MFPLDKIYGPLAFNAFKKSQTDINLKDKRQWPWEICVYDPLIVENYEELVEIVSFLSVINKRNNLYFRGQSKDWPLEPAIFRQVWKSAGGRVHEIPDTPHARKFLWDFLNKEISEIVGKVCDGHKMPRRATLRMFKEAVWAIAQHYELWPTPLIDITPNLRVAASFALPGKACSGFLYVVALPASTNSITFDADQHVVLARLQSVCPPVAKRPHYQDGFLAGRFPFHSPNENQIDKYPRNVSNLQNRLVCKIILKDDNVMKNNVSQFWNSDFPRMSDDALIPQSNKDILFNDLIKYANIIDEYMEVICKGE